MKSAFIRKRFIRDILTFVVIFVLIFFFYADSSGVFLPLTEQATSYTSREMRRVTTRDYHVNTSQQ